MFKDFWGCFEGCSKGFGLVFYLRFELSHPQHAVVVENIVPKTTIW